MKIETSLTQTPPTDDVSVLAELGAAVGYSAIAVCHLQNSYELDVVHRWGEAYLAPMTLVEFDELLARTPSPAPGIHADGDRLIVPLRDEAGELLGVLWLLRPRATTTAPARIEGIAAAVRATSRVLRARLQRDRLARRTRLTMISAAVNRAITAEVDLGQLVQAALAELRAGFAVSDVDVVIEDFAELSVFAGELRFVDVARRVAGECWRRGTVDVISRTSRLSPVMSIEEVAGVRASLAERGLSSIMLIPLGAGPDCLGRIVLRRPHGEPGWNEEEKRAAQRIGADLGRAVLTARAYAREVELAAYRTRMVGAVGRELREPIAEMLHHLQHLEVPPAAAGSAARLTSGVGRLSGLVNDMLSLGHLDEPQPASPSPVDLAGLIREAIDLMAVRATAKDLALSARIEGPVVVRGRRGDLERLVINLISNAVKYTPAGGRIDVVAAGTVEGVGTTFRVSLPSS